VTRAIPALDARELDDPTPAVLERLREAFGEFGILHLSGHGLEPRALDELYASFTAFVREPEEAKQRLAREDLWFQRGWTPPDTEVAVAGDGQPDFKECWFACCTDVADGDRVLFPEIFAENVWPDPRTAELEAFPERNARVAARLQLLGERLLGACARALGLEPATFLDAVRGGPHVTRLLRYLPLRETDLGRDVLWGENHTDFCALTLLPGGRFLPQDPEAQSGGGLFLTTRTGELVSGSPPEGHLVVQVGQQLEVLTGGAFLATPHEIRAPERTGIERLSCAHFIHLHPERVLFPLEPFRAPEAVRRYRPPVLAGTYDVKILVDIGLAPVEALERLGYSNQDRIEPQAAAGA
jgi:isopenicillin N synthase-like dioxygenase